MRRHAWAVAAVAALCAGCGSSGSAVPPPPTTAPATSASASASASPLATSTDLDGLTVPPALASACAALGVTSAYDIEGYAEATAQQLQQDGGSATAQGVLDQLAQAIADPSTSASLAQIVKAENTKAHGSNDCVGYFAALVQLGRQATASPSTG